MDEGNINNDLVVESLNTIPLDDKVQTFINNLGIKIDPDKLKVALCHRSYIFENDYNKYSSIGVTGHVETCVLLYHKDYSIGEKGKKVTVEVGMNK